jgi:hypothetical protein
MPAPASAPFVARSVELELLTGAVRRAAEGEPALVLVGGDAGVGKTRLLTRAAELAERAGASVVVSHCVDLGAGDARSSTTSPRSAPRSPVFSTPTRRPVPPARPRSGSSCSTASPRCSGARAHPAARSCS